MLVETSAGHILLTGDACYIREHWEGMGDTILFDSEQYRSQERLHRLRADVAIMGHDGEACKSYKKQYRHGWTV